MGPLNLLQHAFGAPVRLASDAACTASLFVLHKTSYGVISNVVVEISKMWRAVLLCCIEKTLLLVCFHRTISRTASPQ